MEDKKMTGSATIKSIMQLKHISVSELAKLMSEKGLNIEPRILSGKLNRDTFSLNEYNSFELKNGFDIERELQKKKNSAKQKKNPEAE